MKACCSRPEACRNSLGPCCNRPGPCCSRPEACCSRPGMCCSLPESAVLLSTTQVLQGAAGRAAPADQDQKPDLSDHGANPNRRNGGWGPLRLHEEACKAQGPAGFGVVAFDSRAIGATP